MSENLPAAPDPREVADGLDLAELEEIVDDGLGGLLATGAALDSIKDRKIYREKHPTWEEYCPARFGISSRSADRAIAAYRASRELGAPVSQRKAALENQTRASGNVESEDGKVKALPSVAKAETASQALTAAIDLGPNTLALAPLDLLQKARDRIDAAIAHGYPSTNKGRVLPRVPVVQPQSNGSLARREVTPIPKGKAKPKRP